MAKRPGRFDPPPKTKPATKRAPLRVAPEPVEEPLGEIVLDDEADARDEELEAYVAPEPPPEPVRYVPPPVYVPPASQVTAQPRPQTYAQPLPGPVAGPSRPQAPAKPLYPVDPEDWAAQPWQPAQPGYRTPDGKLARVDFAAGSPVPGLPGYALHTTVVRGKAARAYYVRS